MNSTDKNKGYDLNINKYRLHKRTVPWGLIRKIIVAAILIGLLIYLQAILKEKETETEDLPTEVEL